MVKVVQNNLNAVGETDPGYGQLFAILIRRRFWLFGVLCVVLALATAKTMRAKPTYQSSMQLLVEANYQAKKGDGGVETPFADSNVEVDNATQLSLMRSSVLIQKAVILLRPKYPDITVEEIKKLLNVAQVQQEKVETKIFEVSYSANEPVKTQKVLEAIQKVYQNYNREQQKLRLSRGLAFIDAQLPAVRKSVVQSETALERFRQSQNLIDPESQAKTVVDALSNIEQERRTTRVQYQDFQARYTALQKQLARSPQQTLISSRLSQSSRYQSLLNEIQKTELALAQQRLRFTNDSLIVQKLVEQRQQQLALLQDEVARVVGRQADQVNDTKENLLSEGQLGTLDINLASQLLEAQTNLLGLSARDRVLAQKEQEIRLELKQFPSLLAQYNRLQPEVQLKRETLQQLLKARQELSLEIARGGFDWQVVEKPQLGMQTGPNTKQNLLLGAVVGLMLGGVAAFIREMVDDSVHSSDELTKQVALPLLGMTPELPQGKGSEALIKLPFAKPQVLTPWSIQVIHWPPFREALDLIYQNIQLLNSGSPLKSLMVTSALTGEGKSTLALGLAISAARLHQRVLLIDADLRRPSLHKQLNLPNEQGLSTLLANDALIPSSSGIQVSGQYANISVLTSGPTPLDPAQLLSSHKMKELMAIFEQNYDLVLVDAPPVLGMVDAILAASFCSGVVLVGRIGRVTRTELTQATASLSKLNVIGIVANGASGPTCGYVSYAKQDRILPQGTVGK